jgi:hypothetical protein
MPAHQCITEDIPILKCSEDTVVQRIALLVAYVVVV